MFSRKLRRTSDKLLVVFQDGCVSLETVLETDGEILETYNRCLRLEELDAFVNVDGSVFYASNLDFAAKSESENLKKLRRSSVISNIFGYSKTEKKFDLLGILPWIAVVVIAILK